MKKLLIIFLSLLVFAGCSSQARETYPEDEEEPVQIATFAPEMEDAMIPYLQIEIGGSTLTASFADTQAATELMEHLEAGPITIDASNYGGWEKLGKLPFALSASDMQLTAQPGDIMLYTGDTLVLFYGENTWAYTRLGTILDADAGALRTILSGKEREMTLSLLVQ